MIPLMVVPTLTRHDLLGEMLASVDYPVQHLVVIDNSGRGIVGGTGPWERMTVLPMPENLGVAASWNLAIKLGFRHDWTMIVSDDVRFEPGTLQAWDMMSREDRLLLSATWPHWCAFTIGAKVVSEVGLFDEGFYPAYFEDNDYERRCGRAGLQVSYGPDVLHRNSSTLRTEGAGFMGRNDVSFAANQRLFAEDRPAGFDPYRWRGQSWL